MRKYTFSVSRFKRQWYDRRVARGRYEYTRLPEKTTEMSLELTTPDRPKDASDTLWYQYGCDRERLLLLKEVDELRSSLGMDTKDSDQTYQIVVTEVNAFSGLVDLGNFGDKLKPGWVLSRLRARIKNEITRLEVRRAYVYLSSSDREVYDLALRRHAGTGDVVTGAMQ